MPPAIAWSITAHGWVRRERDVAHVVAKVSQRYESRLIPLFRVSQRIQRLSTSTTCSSVATIFLLSFLISLRLSDGNGSVGRQLPIGTDARRYVQRNGHGDGMLHGILHQRGGLLLLTGRDLHHKFIMNLQMRRLPRFASCQRASTTIMAIFMMSAASSSTGASNAASRAASLFTALFGDLRPGKYLRLPKNGFGISFFACGRDKRFKVFMDFAKSGEILVFQRFGFFGLDLELLGKSIRAQTVGKSIAHRLDVATLIGRDVVNGNAVDQAGHILMEVLAGAEGLYQRLITGKVGHDAQFDLRVVGAQQRFEALSRHERGSNLTTCGSRFGMFCRFR